MTDKEKLDKLVAEIERLYNQSLADENRQAELGLESAACTSYGKSKVCKELLSFYNSMQKEPKKCMYSKDNYTDEDRKVLCDGCKEDCKYARLVWHDATEEPKYKAECLVVSKRGSKEVATYGNGFFHKGHVVCEPCRLYALGDIEKWIYIEDIIK